MDADAPGLAGSFKTLVSRASIIRMVLVELGRYLLFEYFSEPKASKYMHIGHAKGSPESPAHSL